MSLLIGVCTFNRPLIFSNVEVIMLEQFCYCKQFPTGQSGLQNFGHTKTYNKLSNSTSHYSLADGLRPSVFYKSYIQGAHCNNEKVCQQSSVLPIDPETEAIEFYIMYRRRLYRFGTQAD